MEGGGEFMGWDWIFHEHSPLCLNEAAARANGLTFNLRLTLESYWNFFKLAY
jgi:hypothetical protein